MSCIYCGGDYCGSSLGGPIMCENSQTYEEVSRRDNLVRRAEPEISYRAKRAIEMFLHVSDKDKSLTMFDKCAESHFLCQGEAEKCKSLLIKLGFGDNPTEGNKNNS